MSPILTFGDFLTSLRGNSLAIYSVEPLPDELNAGDIEPFVVPSADAIVSLKEQVSYEAWLYLMEADSLGVEYNRLLGQREAQQHLARSIALLDFKDRNTPLNSPAVKTRIRWLQRRVLNLGGDTTPKPYYQLMAEGQMARARRQNAVTAVWNMLSPKERLHRLRERWGDLSPETLEEREQQAQQRQAQENTSTVVQRKVWDLEIDHPAFAPWFVQELIRREPLEIEAYLTIMWHAVVSNAPISYVDSRRLITPEQMPYMKSILSSAIADATGKERRILIRAEEWFERQGDLRHTIQGVQITEGPRALSLRQMALFQYFIGKPIRKGDAADKLAAATGNKSAERLIRLYNEVSHLTGISGREGREILSMIDDLQAVRQIIDSEHLNKIDTYIQILERKIS